MNKNNIINLENPIQDVLTMFLRESAQKMLQLAIEQEVNEFIANYKGQRLEDGRKRIVKNGYLPERSIQTGIGTIKVEVPRIRDRDDSKGKIEFSSSWIPKHMRRTATIDILLPLLYLKGISTGDFSRVLEPILGDDANNLSPAVISRLKSRWLDDYKIFAKKDLICKKYILVGRRYLLKCS